MNQERLNVWGWEWQGGVGGWDASRKSMGINIE